MGVRHASVSPSDGEELARRAVFLDRDGVINRPIMRDGCPHPPRDFSEFAWMDGIAETVNSLRDRGYLIVVFTNQPDVARGTQTQEQVDAFHQRILATLPIERVYVCLHDDSDECACRKPKPGMLLRARADYELDLARCWVVGDRWRDIDAGRAAGCQTVLVRHNYRERAAKADYEIDRIPQLLELIR
jgi:D-glycero-D-manno-heptose 1,7-bisphosphate phosphatase